MSAHHESPFFSPRRFARLARLQWQEQGRAWGMFALVLAVLLVLVAGLMLSGDGRGAATGVQVPVYLAGLLLSGYLFAHQVLGVWRSREASLLYLMRPASTFEKWLLSALTLLVLYPLLYTAVFAAVNAVAGELGYRMALAAAQKMSSADMGADWRTSVDVADFVTFVPLRPHPSVLKLLSLPTQAAWAIVYVTMMAYAALGLVVFRRHAAMRTLVTAIGLCILTFLLMAGFHDSVNWRAVSAWWLSPDEREGLAPAAFVYSWAFWAGIPLLLGAASYRALREKDLS